MKITSSTSLRNHYNEISDYCKKTGEPVFLTKNGEGDLVVLSIEAFEKREQLLKLKEKLEEVEIKRLKGEKDYSPEELDNDMKKLLDNK